MWVQPSDWIIVPPLLLQPSSLHLHPAPQESLNHPAHKLSTARHVAVIVSLHARPPQETQNWWIKVCEGGVVVQAVQALPAAPLAA